MLNTNFSISPPESEIVPLMERINNETIFEEQLIEHLNKSFIASLHFALHSFDVYMGSFCESLCNVSAMASSCKWHLCNYFTP